MNAEYQINRSRRMTQAEDGDHRVLAVRTSHPAAASCDCTEAGMAQLSPLPGTPMGRFDYGGERPPIWFAALAASNCRAACEGAGHDVIWHCISGRAVYTNSSTESETIQPLGIQLQGGYTVAVTWRAGETEYTVETYPEPGNSFRV